MSEKQKASFHLSDIGLMRDQVSVCHQGPHKNTKLSFLEGKVLCFGRRIIRTSCKILFYKQVLKLTED